MFEAEGVIPGVIMPGGAVPVAFEVEGAVLGIVIAFEAEGTVPGTIETGGAVPVAFEAEGIILDVINIEYI